MKLKSVLILLLLLISKAGIAQTKYATINKAWSKLNKAYLLRNESMLSIADTLRQYEAISIQDYSDVAEQANALSDALNPAKPLNAQRIKAITYIDEQLALAFGKLILTSGAKGPDHYYLDQLEGLENRLEVCKRIFNDAAKANGRKDLVFPLAPAPQVKF